MKHLFHLACFAIEFGSVQLQYQNRGHRVNPLGQVCPHPWLADCVFIVVDRVAVFPLPRSINLRFIVQGQKLVEKATLRLLDHGLVRSRVNELFYVDQFAEEERRHFVCHVFCLCDLCGLILINERRYRVILVDVHFFGFRNVFDGVRFRLECGLDRVSDSRKENLVKSAQVTFIADVELVTRVVNDALKNGSRVDVAPVADCHRTKHLFQLADQLDTRAHLFRLELI